jgi:hypothetical protein
MTPASEQALHAPAEKQVADAVRPHDDTVIEPLAAASTVRRAGDVLRLLVALAVLVAAQLLAALAHAGVGVTERALLESIKTLPAVLRDWLSAAAQLIAVVFPAAAIAALASGRRFGLVGRLLLAAVAGTAAAVLVSRLFLSQSHPAGWAELLAGRGGVFDVKFPPVAWLSGATAMLTVGGPELSRRWRQSLWWVVGAAALIEVTVGGFLPVDAVVVAALGVCVGSLVLLAFGGPTNRPTAEQVVRAMQECGVELTALKELSPSTSGPALFRAAALGEAALTVRVLAQEDRDRDRLTRLYRWLTLRDPENDRAGGTVESATEYEMLTMVTAARAGARVPEPVVAYPIAPRQGPAGRSSAGSMSAPAALTS